jgi:hypothetical protein
VPDHDRVLCQHSPDVALAQLAPVERSPFA